jgi:peptidoglycan LD-endopeptidase CwlK
MKNIKDIKMSFKLSKRSLDKLEGVNHNLVNVVHKAIELTKVDFGIVYGLRTLEEQKKLVAAGKSQTLKSKHLDGNAVDLMAYVDGKGCWELNVYDDLADAMKEAAIAEGVPIRWGAAWHIPDIRSWEGTAEAAMMSYIDTRRSQNRRPFIDGPHFELAS